MVFIRILKTPSKESSSNITDDAGKEMEIDTESRSRLSPVPMRSAGKMSNITKTTATSLIAPSTAVEDKLSSISPSLSVEFAPDSSPTMALVDRVLSNTPPPKNLSQDRQNKPSSVINTANDNTSDTSSPTSSSSSPTNLTTFAPTDARRTGLLSHPARRTSVGSNLNSLKEDRDTDEEDNEDENNTVFSFPVSKRLSEVHRRLSTTSLGGGRRSSVGSVYDTGRNSDAAEYIPPNRPWQIEDFNLGIYFSFTFTCESHVVSHSSIFVPPLLFPSSIL